MQVEAVIGEIRMFAGTFAPDGWQLCAGQLLNIVNYQALYSLLGTRYGGDGRTNFALPDYRGRIPMGQGTGPGLTPRVQGQLVGIPKVTLTTLQIPAHAHRMMGSNSPAASESPQNAVVATVAGTFYEAVDTADKLTNMPSSTVGPTGNGTPVDIRMSSCVINYIIAVVGEYPQRS